MNFLKISLPVQHRTGEQHWGVLNPSLGTTRPRGMATPWDLHLGDSSMRQLNPVGWGCSCASNNDPHLCKSVLGGEQEEMEK